MRYLNSEIQAILTAWIDAQQRRAVADRADGPDVQWRAVRCTGCGCLTLSDGTLETRLCLDCATSGTVECIACGDPVVWDGRTAEIEVRCADCLASWGDALADDAAGK
jgi:hypothetical protein